MSGNSTTTTNMKEKEVPLETKDQLPSNEYDAAIVSTLHKPSPDSPPEGLVRVADRIPIQIWLVLIASTSERFTFYGTQACFQNYIQNPANDPLRPGALGLDQATATAISYSFSMLVYMVPIFAAVWVDCYLGRYLGLVVFTSIYLLGGFLLLMTSLPVSLAAGAGLPGFIVSIIIFAIGIGGVKSSISPFMADQYMSLEDRVETRDGKQVLVSRDLSIERVYTLYYWSINIGSLSGIATTFLEKDVAFWAAFLLAFCVLWISLITLVVCRNHYVRRPPGGNVLRKAYLVLRCAMRNGYNIDATLPSKQSSEIVEWDDEFVLDLKTVLYACRVFAAYPILWLCHIQILNNLVTQAGQMETGALPNDIFMNINPVSVLILLPIVQHWLYPALRKAGIKFEPITRMTVGFVIEAVAIAYCAGVQQLIYNRGPCYDYPLECAASDGGAIPNRITVWVQTPVYVIDGLAEIFFDLASQEYAYITAPGSMKSIMQAVLSASSGIGCAVGLALYPVTRNPHLVYMYAALAGAMFVVTCLFAYAFWDYDDKTKALKKESAASIEHESSAVEQDPETKGTAVTSHGV